MPRNDGVSSAAQPPKLNSGRHASGERDSEQAGDDYSPVMQPVIPGGLEQWEPPIIDGHADPRGRGDVSSEQV